MTASDTSVPDPDNLPVDPGNPDDLPTMPAAASGERVTAPEEASKVDEYLPNDSPEDAGKAARDIASGPGIGTTGDLSE
jgi:hypothetical protein